MATSLREMQATARSTNINTTVTKTITLLQPMLLRQMVVAPSLDHSSSHIQPISIMPSSNTNPVSTVNIMLVTARDYSIIGQNEESKYWLIRNYVTNHDKLYYYVLTTITILMYNSGKIKSLSKYFLIVGNSKFTAILTSYSDVYKLNHNC